MVVQTEGGEEPVLEGVLVDEELVAAEDLTALSWEALAERCEAAHQAAERAMRYTLQEALDAGACLMEAKRRLSGQKGAFGVWRNTRGIDERAGQLYMQLARDLPALLAQLGLDLRDLSIHQAVDLLRAHNRALKAPKPPAAIGAPPDAPTPETFRISGPAAQDAAPTAPVTAPEPEMFRESEEPDAASVAELPSAHAPAASGVVPPAAAASQKQAPQPSLLQQMQAILLTMHAMEQAIRQDGVPMVARGIKGQQLQVWLEYRAELQRLLELADAVLDKYAQARPEVFARQDSAFKAKRKAARAGEL